MKPNEEQQPSRDDGKPLIEVDTIAGRILVTPTSRYVGNERVPYAYAQFQYAGTVFVVTAEMPTGTFDAQRITAAVDVAIGLTRATRIVRGNGTET